MNRIRTLILSPYAGDIARNLTYARAAMLDSIRHGEAPFASHLVYTQVLDDTDPLQRELGLACEHAWLPYAEQCVAYVDLGWSGGMTQARKAWEERQAQSLSSSPIIARRIGGLWS